MLASKAPWLPPKNPRSNTNSAGRTNPPLKTTYMSITFSSINNTRNVGAHKEVLWQVIMSALCTWANVIGGYWL